MTVKRFILGVLTAVLTLTVVMGAAFLLAKLEAPEISLPEATEQTLPTQTEPPTEQTIAPQVTEAAVEKTSVNTVPLYFQTDYPYIKFGNGTIATSGCSITCLAMVATYMTDREYTPPQMAHHFGSYGKTNIERLDYGIDQMQLPYQRSSNVLEVLEALRCGKVVIAMMDEESVFTTQQHFIVMAGMNENGKFIVNDPIEDHYNSPEPYIRDSYENGFEDYQLMRGFSGAWIFDKADMPEEPFLFDASIPEQQENRYEGYTLTGEDIYMLACFVCAEAENESAEAKQAVAEVVLNRLMSEKYPYTVHDVIYQTEFYRATDAMKRMDEPGWEQYIAVDAAMYGPYILSEDICYYSAWEKGEEEWGELGSYRFYKNR